MDSEEINQLLDSADGYCSSENCREPRHGPFLIDIDAPGGAILLCYRCYLQERFAIDPDDVGEPWI